MTVNLSKRIQRALLARHPKWLRRQEKAYLSGYNLLMLTTDAFILNGDQFNLPAVLSN